MIILFIKNVIGFLYWKIIDTYNYYRFREWTQFTGFGLHIYVGMFGSGKTSSMIKRAYDICNCYKDVNILTNMKLTNFPPWTKIIFMENYQQIVTCPPNTIILLDELSSESNSREWKKDGVPPEVLRHLLQVRKQKKMMFSTAQRFMHVDALYRQITFTVKDCQCWFGRWNWVYSFDGWEYENKQNAIMPIPILSIDSFIQTNKIRNLYDTNELIEKLKRTEYIPNDEILLSQGTATSINIINDEMKKPSLFDKILKRKATAK